MTSNTTPIQQKLDSDFAALFGPSQPPSAPEDSSNDQQQRTQTDGQVQILPTHGLGRLAAHG